MECKKCKAELEKDSRFCPSCGEKIEKFEIKKDIGEEALTQLKELLRLVESKKKAEEEKLYPCPHCSKEITIQQLKSKLNFEGKSLNETKAQ